MQIVMANDPHRDYLPVKEYSGRSGRGSNERFDHQFLSKLPRCELEDKVHRLLDEQTQLKKLLNTQEEKIKRLGTKLLRIIGEKKNGKKVPENSKESDELSLRIIELEHENYSLKDKNTVLKQQLASHSQGAQTHRSPARATPQYSVYMSTRHSQGPLQSEAGFDTASKNDPTEAQLQAAEAHIRELNEEIKTLHQKIDSLQQNLEKNSLDNRKTKVAENIELIRLQRSLKQQAIQISALQEQVVNSENNQKILKEELLKAHNENEEALQLISLKQNEILNLCSKLEEKNLNRLEENELKERIKDLTKERDFLKERCDQLLEKITGKHAEIQQLEELRKLLAEEKEKKENLEDLVEEYQMCLANKFAEENASRSQELLKEGGDSLSKIGDNNSKFNRSLLENENIIRECTEEEEEDDEEEEEEYLKQKEIEEYEKQKEQEEYEKQKEREEYEKQKEREEYTKQKEREEQAKQKEREEYAKQKEREEYAKQKEREEQAKQKEREEYAKQKEREEQAKQKEREEQAKQKEREEYAKQKERDEREEREEQEEEEEEEGEQGRRLRQQDNLKAVEIDDGSYTDCLTLCECSQTRLSNPDSPKSDHFHQSSDKLSERFKEKEVERVTRHCLCKIQEEKYYAERMKLERELQYLREMLRSQTARCEVQQAEISRLMYELRLNEDKCNDTLRKLDIHLKIFQHFDTKTRENETPPEGVEFRKKSNSPTANKVLQPQPLPQPLSQPQPQPLSQPLSQPQPQPLPQPPPPAETSKTPSREEIKTEIKSKDNSTYDSLELDKPNAQSKRANKKNTADPDTKKRFVDQVFLESSDEENGNEKSYDRDSFIKKLEELGAGGSQKEPNESDFESTPVSPTKASTVRKKSSPENFLSDSSLLKNQGTSSNKTSDVDNHSSLKLKSNESSHHAPYVKIMINWLQADTSKSIWKDDRIKLIFIDFSFLDVKGEETETPDSLPKPSKPQEVCVFNFTKRIEILDSKKKILNSLLNRSELALIVFKCVSDPEDTAEECEDFGIAEVTVKEFLDKSGKGPFQIPLKNLNNPKEVIGKLNISIETSADLYNVSL